MTVVLPTSRIYHGAFALGAMYKGADKVWPSEFVLSTIPGMTLWIDADDVQQGDGTITVPVPMRVGPPAYPTPGLSLLVDGIGGHKAFNFNPAIGNQWIDLYNITLGPDVTVLAVVDAGYQPSQYADLMDFSHSAAGGWVIQQNDHGPTNYCAWRVGSAYTLAETGPYPGVSHIVELVKQGGHVSLTIGDGNTGVMDGPSGLDTPTTQLRIGEYVLNGRPFLGKIAMVAGWNRALTPAELAQVRGYLKGKWGLP